jgi:hypothetical protein
MPSSYFLINPSEACMRCKRVRSGRLCAVLIALFVFFS